MEVVTDLAFLRKKRSPIVMAAGFFDGVHMGHQKVIKKAVAAAEEVCGKAWILTFANHPLSILSPKHVPALLTTVEQKVEQLRRLNVDGCLVIPFTKDLAGRLPCKFVEELLYNIPALRRIFVGSNWRFGKDGEGTPEILSGICREAGVKVSVVGSIKKAGVVISSTSIRAAVSRGDMQSAASLLGRDYSFTGDVVRGMSIGRQLGYPTANIKTGNEILFPCGVYAVQAVIGANGRRIFDGILNYGARPTFASGGKRGLILEMHLFDVDMDLYGKHMEVFVKSRIRDEKKFGSPENLRHQIMQDVKGVKKIL